MTFTTAARRGRVSMMPCHARVPAPAWPSRSGSSAPPRQALRAAPRRPIHEHLSDDARCPCRYRPRRPSRVVLDRNPLAIDRRNLSGCGRGETVGRPFNGGTSTRGLSSGFFCSSWFRKRAGGRSRARYRPSSDPRSAWLQRREHDTLCPTSATKPRAKGTFLFVLRLDSIRWSKRSLPGW